MDFSDSVLNTGPPLTISDPHLPDHVDNSGGSSLMMKQRPWQLEPLPMNETQREERRILKEVTQEMKTLRVTIITCNKNDYNASDLTHPLK